MREKERRELKTRVWVKATAWALISLIFFTTLFSGFIDSTYGTESIRILDFERVSPVYTESVEAGTLREDLRLPTSLRAVCKIKAAEPESGDEGTKSEAEFFQTTPPVGADGDFDYYWWGYVAPKNEAELREADELVIYTIYYADGREVYRVHGTYDGLNESFYACDLDGNISGIVRDVPVTWTGEYSENLPGIYTFTAQADGFSFPGNMPTAEITVTGEVTEKQPHVHTADCNHAMEIPSHGENPVPSEPNDPEAPPTDNTANSPEGTEEPLSCTCALASGMHSLFCPLYAQQCTCGLADDGHVEGCLLWNVACACPEGTIGHTTSACPYWVPMADCDCGIDSTNKPWQHNSYCHLFEIPTLENGGCFCPDGIHDPSNTDCLLYTPPMRMFRSISPNSINGGGTNDIRGNEFMRTTATTSGNGPYTSEFTENEQIPGSWVDYINTIWMNKAYNKFAWTPAADTNAHSNSSYNNGDPWAWGGSSAIGTTGSPSTNPNKPPAVSDGAYQVYSGEQLRTALTQISTGNNLVGYTRINTIKLCANIDMNGNQYAWRTVVFWNVNGSPLVPIHLTIDGGGYTIYNLGVTPTFQAGPGYPLVPSSALYSGSFVYGVGDLTVQDITFATAKIVAPSANITALFPTDTFMGRNGDTGLPNTTYTRTYTDVTCRDSLFFGQDMVAPFGYAYGGANSSVSFTRCFTYNNFVYGKDHIAGFTQGLTGGTLNNCSTYNSLLCGTGGHSAGLVSCLSTTVSCTDCFADVELYGSAAVGGFMGFMGGRNENCFSTGKVEGYTRVAGFVFTTNQQGGQIYENCYSTSLVGMRTRPKMQGGFAVTYRPNLTNAAAALEMTNCYAAGEVGNYDVILTNPQNVGGFIASADTSVPHVPLSMNNCYYDKQTTAMREWAAGNTKDLTGVTGVLTTDSDKEGPGFAESFRGLGVTSWTYQQEHYPQLSVFANADQNPSAWGSKERADAVKAWSLASTATVFLNTWDIGYDWNNNGVRTAEKTGYDRTLEEAQAEINRQDHLGYQYTYDTVRESVSDFKATNVTDNATLWRRMIPGGAPAIISNGNSTKSGDNIAIVGGKGTVKHPGMDWYEVNESADGQTGSRTLRVIAYMDVNAGEDRTVPSGTKYNHRTDVRLTMMDTITDDLVVGFDDEEIWSTAKIQLYPNSTGYYAVTTEETSFSASKNAWVYTEIWRAERDSDGNYLNKDGGIAADDSELTPEYSVKVTGLGTGSNETIDERKWNGQLPLHADTSLGHKYIITYFWMLSDGRYRTDDKVITIIPGEFDLKVNVFDGAGIPESTSLSPAAAPDDAADTDYSFDGPSSTAQALGNPYTTNVTAAWKKVKMGTSVEKIEIVMTTIDGDELGKASVTGEDLTEGSVITVPVSYEYITSTEYDPEQGKIREITKQEDVNITYTVKEDTDGGYYLQFNKIANAPGGETEEAKANKDDTGVSAQYAYVNDMSYNITVNLFVRNGNSLIVKKTLTAPAEEEETFVFQVDYRGNGAAAGSVTRTMYAVITIPDGQSIGSAKFRDVPVGWYTVTELDSNWRFNLLTGRLAGDNPGAEVDAQNGKVTILAQDGAGIYSFWNSRADIPWANGKHRVTNDMPSIE